MAASAREFPFDGADGSHRATLPVETDPVDWREKITNPKRERRDRKRRD
jgi:hypothetical protein